MEQYPPVDIVVAGWLKAQAPKPIGEQAGGAGLPVRKGKVIKRGDIRR
jgi:hypothetical protein